LSPVVADEAAGDEASSEDVLEPAEGSAE